MKRQTVIIVGLGALLGVGVGVAWRLATAETELERLIPRLEVSELSLPGSPMSVGHDEYIVWLFNDIGRPAKWRPEDRERVLEVLSAWSARDVAGDAMTMAEFEEWDTLRAMIDMLAARVDAGTEIEPEVVRAWHAQVVDLLAHPQAYARMAAVGNAGVAGMLFVPGIRATVERLAVSDPDEMVRRVAHIKLAQQDGRDPGVIPCATCPGGILP
jgi:hypothetical protein